MKPGATYPFRVFVKNFRSAAATNATVTVAPADGMVFTSDLTPSAGSAALDPSGTARYGDRPCPVVPVVLQHA